MLTNVSRRTFLMAGAVSAAAAVLPALPATAAFTRTGPRVSNLPKGRLPSSSSVLVVDKELVLDRDLQVAGVLIKPRGRLVFDPTQSVTLVSTGNVEVQGELCLAPGSVDSVHSLRFEGIKEANYVGGGMQVLASDIGLWVTGQGRLRLQGPAKTPWIRAAGALAVGARQITLAQMPQGWLVGDEITITPTAALTTTGVLANERYSNARITAINGPVVTLDAPIAHAHPILPLGGGLTTTAQVLNLSRNVRIEGTPTGRAHIMLLAAVPQAMSHFVVRHVGPRQGAGSDNVAVLGRYALHFHMLGDASRGTHVVGAVVRDAGGHAFVPHESHGITLTSCISHNTTDDAFWYDGPKDTRSPAPLTHDLTLDSCVASLVKTLPVFRGYRLCGFWIGAGRGNKARNCTAVGVQGNVDASGFQWPEGSSGLWDFVDCLSHNNRRHGLFTWQNEQSPHVVRRFVAVNNGGAGISHGAYVNRFTYEDVNCVGNGLGMLLHSNSAERGQQVFRNLRIEAGGRNHAVEITKHRLLATFPTLFEGCSFSGYAVSAIGFTYDGKNGTTTPDHVDLVECVFSKNELTLGASVLPGSRIRLQTRTGKAYLAQPCGPDRPTYTAWGAANRLQVPPFTTRPMPRSYTPSATIAAPVPTALVR